MNKTRIAKIVHCGLAEAAKVSFLASYLWANR